MSPRAPTWFVPPAGVGTAQGGGETCIDFDIDVQEPAPARRARAHWLFAAAVPVAVGAVTAGLLLSAVPEATARPATEAAPVAGEVKAPQVSSPLEAEADEELLPAPEFAAVQPREAATASRRPRRLAADGRLRATSIKLAAPAAGKDRPTAALNAKAAKLAKRQDWRGAFSMYLRATRLSPNDPEGWFGQALCHYELKHPRAASEAARRALLADPGHPLSNVLAGFLAQEGGRFDEARALYSRYLAVEPQGPHAGELKSVLDHLPAP
ncbi:MAG: tetratricopeptide repeat protein [Myxococcaceae bacterium]